MGAWGPPALYNCHTPRNPRPTELPRYNVSSLKYRQYMIEYLLPYRNIDKYYI